MPVPGGRFLPLFVASRAGDGSAIRRSVFGPTRAPAPLGQISAGGESPTSAGGGGGRRERGSESTERAGWSVASSTRRRWGVCLLAAGRLWWVW